MRDGWLNGCVDGWLGEKWIYIDKTHLGEPPPEPGRNPARRPPEAGRQNFERIPAAIRGRKKPFANRIREFDIRRGLKRVKNEFIFTKRISENLRRTSAGRPPEAGRQNFERIPAAIKGRKKPFANRIREFDIRRGLKKVKNKFIFTKRISENLRRNRRNRRNPVRSRTAKFWTHSSGNKRKKETLR